MLKSEVVDLLIENQPTIVLIANRIRERQTSPDVNLFDNEVRTQFLNLVRSELASELYNKGLTISDLNVIIGTDELGLFIEEVLKNEQDQ